VGARNPGLVHRSAVKRAIRMSHPEGKIFYGRDLPDVSGQETRAGGKFRIAKPSALLTCHCEEHLATLQSQE